MHRFGTVVLAEVQYTDTFEIKTRPAIILFAEYNNVVVADITSNTEMKGVALTKKEGAVKDSVIKLNYIFTISSNMIKKTLFSISEKKKKEIYEKLIKKLKSAI